MALALVALAQQERGLSSCATSNAEYSTISDLSIEHVASLAAQNALPIPSLDLDAIVPPSRRDTLTHPDTRGAPQPSYSEDPWQNPRFSDNGTNGSLTNGAPSSISGTGLPRDWWKRQELVQVRIAGLHGFVLNRYMLYEVSSEVCVVWYRRGLLAYAP